MDDYMLVEPSHEYREAYLDMIHEWQLPEKEWFLSCCDLIAPTLMLFFKKCIV